MPNPLISQVTLPNGTTYDIKDGWSRDQIAAIYALIEGGVHFIGVVADSPAHQISDGDTTNPITVKDGSSTKSVTATAGDIVIQGTTEFIFDGTAWRQFGDITGLGDLAFADTASGPFTPAGTVSKPTFTGSQSNVTITATDNTSGNYQPKGTVSKPTFSGTKVKISGTVTPSGSVSGSFTGTGVRLVTGNIAVPKTYSTTFTNTNKSTTVSAAASGDTTYTPAGNVSGTAVEMNTTSVNSITAVGTLPSWSATVPAGTENLTFTWNTGTLPTKGAAQTVATTVKSVTDPTFSGTGVRLVTGNISVPTSASTTTATTENKTATVSAASSGEATYTPSGSVSGTFTGDSNTVAVTVTTDANGNYTPAGTVSQPTFTGTKVQLSGTTTASGSVSQPTFTGTQGTVTVTPDTP